jgi:hypothetical protein
LQFAGCQRIGKSDTKHHPIAAVAWHARNARNKKNKCAMNVPFLLSLAFVSAGVSISASAADLAARRPDLSSVESPPPAAGGARRILLVDDDVSNNNHTPGDARLSPSDLVFRKLVADAVGGDSGAWEIETVKPYASGPGIERLRPFSLIVWYTGASYGGNPDNTAVLSIEDEKTVRRYLDEVGGAVILVSPGYLSKVLDAGSTGDKANWPFLTEVVGVRGGVGLAKRFEGGIVKAAGGASFKVGKGSATVESQFSTINPGSAAVVFTTSLLAANTSDTPVATASPYGRGRIVYVGFTFENLAEADLAPAFQALLTAAAPQATFATAAAPPATPTLGVVRPEMPVKRQPVGAGPAPLTLQVGGIPTKTVVSWTLPSAPIDDTSTPFSGQIARRTSPVPDPGLTVKVERWRRYVTLVSDAYDWEVMAVQPGVSQVVDYAAQPGSTQRYRVTVTNATGASGFKEVEYIVPSIQDPPSLSANQQSDGTVVLSWPEVPGITRYQVETIVPRPGGVSPAIVIGATQWRSAPLDGRLRVWTVTSLYEVQKGEYASLSTSDSRPVARTESNPEYVLTNAMFGIYTGDDNKELLSHFEIRLYINGGGTNTDPNNLQQYGVIVGRKDVELKVNSGVSLTGIWKPGDQWFPALGDLANIKRYGLRIVIKYFPNFFLDAWKLDKVDLTVSFQKASQVAAGQYSEGMHLRTIMSRNVGKLLTERDNQVELIIDGSLITIPSW